MCNTSAEAGAAMDAEVRALRAERDAARRQAAQIAFRGIALVRAVISRECFDSARNIRMDDAAYLLEKDITRVFMPGAVLRSQVEAAVLAAFEKENAANA